MLNKAGKTGISERSLFTGPESRARRWSRCLGGSPPAGVPGPFGTRIGHRL